MAKRPRPSWPGPLSVSQLHTIVKLRKRVQRITKARAKGTNIERPPGTLYSFIRDALGRVLSKIVFEDAEQVVPHRVVDVLAACESRVPRDVPGPDPNEIHARRGGTGQLSRCIRCVSIVCTSLSPLRQQRPYPQHKAALCYSRSAIDRLGTVHLSLQTNDLGRCHGVCRPTYR